jgi:hypothetical protein
MFIETIPVIRFKLHRSGTLPAAPDPMPPLWGSEMCGSPGDYKHVAPPALARRKHSAPDPMPPPLLSGRNVFRLPQSFRFLAFHHLEYLHQNGQHLHTNLHSNRFRR